MFKNKKSAFTLVELIVVITILAILGTIAFISMQGYSKSSRDSVRSSDMSKIKTSLELFNIGAGKYPMTTSGNTISYLAAEVWTQGIFGHTTFNSVDKLDKIPKDPLTGKEYTYSLLNTKQEYEIAGIMEGDDYAMIDNSYAGDKIATAKVVGTYNGEVAKVTKLGTTYVLALPSIVTTNPGADLDLQNIVNNNQLVYNNYSNLPANYSSGAYNVEGEGVGFNVVNSGSLEVFSGNLANLLGDSDSYRVALIQNLQNAYSGTTIANEGGIDELINVALDDSESVKILGLLVVNNSLGGNIAIKGEVIIEKDFAGYVISEIIGWFKLNVTFSGEVVTGYVESEVVGWICMDNSCGSSVIRDKNNGTLSGYALSEIFGWINMDGVTLSNNGSMSGYAQSEILGHIKF